MRFLFRKNSLKTGSADTYHFEENAIAGRGDVNYEPVDYEAYDPEHLLDSVLDRLGLHTDTALAQALQVTPSVIEDIRYMRRPVDAAMLIWIHELTGIDVGGLRNILGDRRGELRFPDDEPKPSENS